MDDEILTSKSQTKNPLLVEVENLTKIFSRSVWSIKKVNFKIYKEDAIALIGPNGSGKTSLAQLVGNITKQTSGNIDYYFETDNILKAIGYQSREQAWPVGFRVRDVFDLYITAFEVKDQTWIAKLIDVFEIQTIMDKKLTKLNILSLQLFAICLVLLYKPELLIIDELSAAISFEKKMRILNLLKEYRASGGTILLVQPEDFILNALCNRVFMLNNGEIQDEAYLTAILKDYGSTFEYARQLSYEMRNNQKPMPLNRSFEVVLRKYYDTWQSFDKVYRMQFPSFDNSRKEFLEIEIRNALYYVGSSYQTLEKSLSSAITKKSIDLAVQSLKMTVHFLHRVANQIKRNSRQLHNDLRYKKVEIEINKSLVLLEKKLLPLLKNGQFFTTIEESESSISKTENKQLRILKRRYIREEIRIMKLEHRNARKKKQFFFFSNNPPIEPHEPQELQSVADALQQRVDATVVLGPDETIELVANNTTLLKNETAPNGSQTHPTIKLANAKKSPSEGVAQHPTLEIQPEDLTISNLFEDVKEGDE